MNQGRNKIKDLLATSNVEQILIPEIQRDYVWTAKNVAKLLASFEEDMGEEALMVSKNDTAIIKQLSQKLKEIVDRGIIENKVYSNIGFIYAYYDGQMPDRYFLIDGQQRITTLYLLLMALAIQEGPDKIDYFRRNYFKDQLPKVDYKVRETAQTFLRKFINYVLDGNEIENITAQYWYLRNYNNDQTIKSLIRNYTFLSGEYVKNTPLTFDYVENEIEFWYFDTNKSEQGEELYIYMNSRGESVQSNENIKALLLEKRSESEKAEWGLQWEQWQSFFWKNRGANKNADKGFDEFLKCVKIIGKVGLEKDLTQTAAGDYIKELRNSNRISTDYLSLESIKKYFLVIKRIASLDGYSFFNKDWLTGKTGSIDYIRLFPVLLYLEKYPEAELFHIYRFGRFFNNLSEQEDPAKTPRELAVQGIRLMDAFLERGLKDVIDFAKVDSERFKMILTEEEIFKLEMYENPPESFSREEVEKMFWEIEDFRFSNGKIEIIQKFLPTDEPFDLNLFKIYSIHFRALFEEPDDLLRRALLTFENYSFWEYHSGNLNMHRYNFGNDDNDWRKIIKTDFEGSKIIKSLLDEFKNFSTELTRDEYHARFLTLISNFKSVKENEEKREFYFVTNEKVLAYCQKKRAYFSEEDKPKIVLLKKERATKFIELEKFLSK